MQINVNWVKTIWKQHDEIQMPVNNGFAQEEFNLEDTV